MIVKIQRPLSSSEPLEDAPALIYNEDRSFWKEVPMSEVSEAFKDGQAKVYCKVRISKGTITIIKRVADRPW